MTGNEKFMAGIPTHFTCVWSVESTGYFETTLWAYWDLFNMLTFIVQNSW
jgi:hypothetical protein